jgi:hypothetical protein
MKKTDMIEYLLTAIVFPPCGSGKLHELYNVFIKYAPVEEDEV